MRRGNWFKILSNRFARVRQKRRTSASELSQKGARAKGRRRALSSAIFRKKKRRKKGRKDLLWGKKLIWGIR